MAKLDRDSKHGGGIGPYSRLRRQNTGHFGIALTENQHALLRRFSFVEAGKSNILMWESRRKANTYSQRIPQSSDDSEVCRLHKLN